MLTLDTKLVLDADAISSPNLCSRFDTEDLVKIGNWCFEGYQRDKLSRRRWEQRNEAGMDLALQIQKDKNFPWPGCSNIAFPLVTIGALQFHARAYPALVSGADVAKCRVIGEDQTGEKTRRARRISTHMSYQVLEQDKSWEEQHDRLILNVSIVGTAFKKSYHDMRLDTNRGELVLAKDLVLDYWAKSVEDCPRKTHIIPFFRNDIHERVLRGTFRDVLEESWFKQDARPQQTTQRLEQDGRSGLTVPQADETTPFTGLEQHCSLDLDGDGYAEPYIITFEESSKCVLRIVTRFDRPEDIERVTTGPKKGKIISIQALEYFTKYGFIPSPDGGIMDIGFGVLLGPLNEATNSLINQLVDSGTMSNTAGGFLARGAKIRGGVYTFAPLEWKRVDSSGEDLQKSIYPLPVREPSNVLFQLLGLLINYTSRVSGTTDIMVGENPGQNTPAETSRLMAEQGAKIYSALFKRLWRCMKEEFKKLYILNGIYLPVKYYFGSDNKFALREDYLGNPDDVVPAADPNITSDNMAVMQATALKQAAMATPGYDVEAVERRYLRAIKIDNPDEVYGGTKKFPPPPNAKLQIENLRAQVKMAHMKSESAQFAAQLMEDQRLNTAEIAKLQAQVIEIAANIHGDQKDREINAINAAIGVLKHHNEVLMGRIDAILRSIEIGADDGEIPAADSGGEAAEEGGGRVPGMAGTPRNQAPQAAAAALATAGTQ